MPLDHADLTITDECLARLNAAIEKNREWLRSIPREEFEDPGISEISVVIHFTPLFGRLVYLQAASGKYPADDNADMVF